MLTLHGFAAEFARDLRERGVEAWALSEQNQLELALEVWGAHAPSRARCGAAAAKRGGSSRAGRQGACATQSEFHEFADVGEAIAATPAKLEKIRLLAEYLRTLEPDAAGRSRRFILPANHFRKAICARSRRDGPSFIGR